MRLDDQAPTFTQSILAFPVTTWLLVLLLAYSAPILAQDAYLAQGTGNPAGTPVRLWFTADEHWEYWDGAGTWWGRSENLTGCQTWMRAKYVRAYANVTGTYYVKLTDSAPGVHFVDESNCLVQGTESGHYTINAGSYRDFWIDWDSGCCSSGSGNLTIALFKDVLLTDPQLDAMNFTHKRDWGQPSAPIVNLSSSSTCIGIDMSATDTSGSTASGIYGFEIYMDGVRKTGDGVDGLFTANGSGYRYAEFCGLGVCSAHSFTAAAVDQVRFFSMATGRNGSTLCPTTTVPSTTVSTTTRSEPLPIPVPRLS